MTKNLCLALATALCLGAGARASHPVAVLNTHGHAVAVFGSGHVHQNVTVFGVNQVLSLGNAVYGCGQAVQGVFALPAPVRYVPVQVTPAVPYQAPPMPVAEPAPVLPPVPATVVPVTPAVTVVPAYQTQVVALASTYAHNVATFLGAQDVVVVHDHVGVGHETSRKARPVARPRPRPRPTRPRGR